METVAALYKFTPIDDPAAIKPGLEAVCADGGVTGTLILAHEGINGTIAGPAAGIDAAMAAIRGIPGCAAIEVKFSTAEGTAFRRLKVRLKREIVTMRAPGVDPRAAVGRYVAPEDWNDLIAAPDVAVIDTRNDYEVSIGTFRGAIDPETRSFTEFPDWWRENKERFEGKRIAMFCTGGIRCEKSTSFLAQEGVEAFHLKGGILKYLETVDPKESLWDGDCFVFDKRVSVGHGLKEGPHVLCHGCRRPLHPDDLDHPDYEAGVSCHWCISEHSDEDRARFRERHRQLSDE